MKEREISPKQAKYLVTILERYNPKIKNQINDHKWLMSERMGYDVGGQVATMDYLKKRLSPKEEGYAVCFLDMIPDGKHFVKRDKRAHCDKCNDWKNYMQAQKNELKEELSLNAWFIGEKLNREISELESQAYFLQNCEDWFIGFRACYEERVCKYRGNSCSCYQKQFVKELPEKIKKLFEEQKNEVA